MNHVLLHDCNASYINLAMSKMNLTFAECLIPESAVLETLVRLADSLFSSFAEYEI